MGLGNAAILAITTHVHRCIKVTYFAIIGLVCWFRLQHMMINETSIDQLKTIIVFQCLFNIWQANHVALMSSYHNSHFLAFKSNVDNVFINNRNNDNNNSRSNGLCCTIMNKLMNLTVLNNIVGISLGLIEMGFTILWILFVNCNLNFVCYTVFIYNCIYEWELFMDTLQSQCNFMHH